jgi:hypothetical protein
MDCTFCELTVGELFFTGDFVSCARADQAINPNITNTNKPICMKNISFLL